METMPAGVRRLCVAVDIKGYSKRSRLDQLDAQRQLVRVLDEAAAAAGVNRDLWLLQQAGDGELGLLPANADDYQFIPTFVSEVVRLLDEVNAEAPKSAQIRVRMAIDAGLVHQGDNGYVGPAVVNVTRMVDSANLRNALNRDPQAQLALAVSAHVYQDALTDPHDLLPPKSFWPVRATTKDGQLDVWLCRPGRPSMRPATRLRIAIAVIAVGVLALLGSAAIGLITAVLTFTATGLGVAAAAGVTVLTVLAVRAYRQRLVVALAALSILLASGAAALATNTVNVPPLRPGDRRVPVVGERSSGHSRAAGTPDVAASSVPGSVGSGTPTSSTSGRATATAPKLATTIECPGVPACRTTNRYQTVVGRLSAAIPPGRSIQLFGRAESRAWWWHGTPMMTSSTQWSGTVGLGPVPENVTRPLPFDICLLLATPEFMHRLNELIREDKAGITERGLMTLPAGAEQIGGCAAATRLPSNTARPSPVTS